MRIDVHAMVLCRDCSIEIFIDGSIDSFTGSSIQVEKVACSDIHCAHRAHLAILFRVRVSVSDRVRVGVGVMVRVRVGVRFSVSVRVSVRVMCFVVTGGRTWLLCVRQRCRRMR